MSLVCFVPEPSLTTSEGTLHVYQVPLDSPRIIRRRYYMRTFFTPHETRRKDEEGDRPHTYTTYSKPGQWDLILYLRYPTPTDLVFYLTPKGYSTFVEWSEPEGHKSDKTHTLSLLETK